MMMASSLVYQLHRKGPSGMLRRLLLRPGQETSGTAAVEFGVIVPLLALMVVSVADIGLGVARKMQVEDAVQLGAAYAVVHGFDASAISAIVTGGNSAISASPTPTLSCGCAGGSSVTAVGCGSTCPGGATAGTYVTVSAQTTYNTTLNYGVVPSSYNLSAQSTVRLQ
jgi:Flp pilus assembly protein TadG